MSLHVYDVGSTALNNVLRPLGTGMFHCGVEVYAFEWAFTQQHDEDTGSGVFCSPPRQAEPYKFRETVDMGCTTMSPSEVHSVIHFLLARWPASSYHTLRRNCCHFAAELCRMLGVGAVPEWTLHAAGAGASLDSNIKVAFRTLRVAGQPGLCCTSCSEDAGEQEELDLVKPLAATIGFPDGRRDLEEDVIDGAVVTLPAWNSGLGEAACSRL